MCVKYVLGKYWHAMVPGPGVPAAPTSFAVEAIKTIIYDEY